MTPELTNVLTCADHGDGRFYINPLVCVDAGVDEDEAVEVGLLHSAQSVLDGVIVLQRQTDAQAESFIREEHKRREKHVQVFTLGGRSRKCRRLTSMFSLPLYLPGLL